MTIRFAAIRNTLLVVCFLLGHALHATQAPTGKTRADIIKAPEHFAFSLEEVDPYTTLTHTTTQKVRASGFGTAHSEYFAIGHYDDGSSRLLRRWLENDAGQASLCLTYAYQDDLIIETLYGPLSDSSPDLALEEDGTPIDNGVDHYQTIYRFSEENLLTNQIEPNEKEVIYRYVPGSNGKVYSSRICHHQRPIQEILIDYDDDGNVVDIMTRSFETPKVKSCIEMPPLFESFSATAYYIGREMARASGRAVVHLIHDLYDMLNLDTVGSSMGDNPIVSEAFLLLMGCNVEEHRCGVIGWGEASERIRITHINGMLNRLDHALDSAIQISELHGGVNVHYIHNSTDGWTWDILGAIMSKLGATTLQARHLARTWRECIEELGGPESNGEIIHYAHSLGGTDTLAALRLMTPEERMMIRVYTFGSPTMVPPEGVKQVTNYVSRRDGVGLIGVIFDPDYVTWVGSPWGIPFVDHYLGGDTYQSVLTDMGSNFVRAYGRVIPY